MSELTLSHALKLWIAHGGSTFGPRVEHVSMKESDFLGFCLALRAHPVEAGEVVAVPREPTEAMIGAFFGNTIITREGSIKFFDKGYAAMIAAAPKEPRP